MCVCVRVYVFVLAHVRGECACGPTEHALRDGEGDGGSAGHPPAGGEVGEVRAQHLHDHLVVQGQVELLVVYELGERETRAKIPLQISFFIRIHKKTSSRGKVEPSRPPGDLPVTSR